MPVLLEKSLAFNLQIKIKQDCIDSRGEVLYLLKFKLGNRMKYLFLTSNTLAIHIRGDDDFIILHMGEIMRFNKYKLHLYYQCNLFSFQIQTCKFR